MTNESLRFYAQQDFEKRRAEMFKCEYCDLHMSKKFMKNHICIEGQLEERRAESQRVRELMEKVEELKKSLLICDKTKKENEMNIEFDKDVVKYDLSSDTMVASRLLRKSRRTTIFSTDENRPRGGQVGKMNVEEEIVGKFVKGFSHNANVDLYISWEQSLLQGNLRLIVDLIPLIDIKPGSVIKIGEIYF